ncbi:MAG TPA: DNA gyrase C-terminal beta-propeller domain-containing protein, partial [Bacteroidales bacterium]|nr:DNA gyrase C-terminal beta-propeller domain-containing protein [Bacteroidales bacterium]
DRNGLRIVIILKKEAVANVVLNNLLKYTQLQTAFNVNNIALVNGRPRLLNLKQLIGYFVKHRHDVVVRRSQFELDQAEKKKHILEGLLVALDHLDEVIQLIRSSATPDIARDGLMTRFGLSEAQAKAILDLRLQRLTGLERDKIREEHDELVKLITYLQRVLSEEPLRMQIIKDELLELKAKYGDDRRTEITHDADEFNPEDFIANEPVVITLTHMGYIKRTSLTEFRTQSRGGKGSKGSDTREEDFIEYLFSATTHNTMLFFTEKGRCFWLKVYDIPEGSRSSKGRAIQNLILIEPDDKIKACINVKTLEDESYVKNHYIVLATRMGIIKKTTLEAYSRPRQTGINAINIREGDVLIDAQLTSGNHDILLAVRSGLAIRFNEKKVRPVGRNASGVRGIKLGQDDEVIGMVCTKQSDVDILVVSEKGYGKRSALEDYRITNRGGKGVKTMKITTKTGPLVAIKKVTDEKDLMIINKSGLTIRLAVSDLRVMGRATQGVRLINLKEGETVAAVAVVPKSEEEMPQPDLPEDGSPALN